MIDVVQYFFKTGKLCKLKLIIHPTISSLAEEVKRIKAVFNNKNKAAFIAKSALSATVWHIWQERNNSFFQAQARNKIMVFMNLYEDIHVLVHNYHWKSSVDHRELEILTNWGL